MLQPFIDAPSSITASGEKALRFSLMLEPGHNHPFYCADAETLFYRSVLESDAAVE